MILEKKLEELLKPTIETMGFELWAVEYMPAGRHSTLRVFVDKESGITVDDCADISRQLSAVLDVEDPITNAYMLEVSSPGLDRPLIKPEHFKRYEGKQVRLRTVSSVLGRKKFTGPMTRVTDEGIEVEVDGELFEIPFDMIDKANLVVEI
ncbi:ribosome maturation factor RimP [Thiomicrorhabdus sp. ZW0627]|uniref:ribosome maturation factor RimP n=1 Tax=Thiomicrorhabdus sp. ZW0627 TaxID=3039774 RepID=UPI0024369FBE|nr:ribosome maturation factor RimP [Thiomicrorhabdus sp. ZW0627]MDG6773090.1 ribosome maturation factor RimP [Thiomicrorhabdus sp. ZW0627]